jgi:AcrR family transcriptional regulator
VPYEGSVYLTDVPRAKLLHAVGEVVRECGYERLSVARLASRAGVSQELFREIFGGGSGGVEDCYLQAFEEAVVEAEYVAGAACGRVGGLWHEKARAAMGAVSAFFDERPDRFALLVSESAKAGPRVVEHYASTVRRIGLILHGSACGTENGGWLPPEDGECALQSILSLARVLAGGAYPELLYPCADVFMSMLVLRYEGPAAAERELALQRAQESSGAVTITSSSTSAVGGGRDGMGVSLDVLKSSKLRVTYRTSRVLGAIAKLGGEDGPYPSNAQIAEHADIADQGQMSKLLWRLEGQGLVEEVSGNAAGRQAGVAYQWCLTEFGREVERAYGNSPSGGGFRPLYERRGEHR